MSGKEQFGFRPQLMRSIPTPITVSHKLGIEVLFSVWGEDEQGNKLPGNGPGALRALMVEKGTMIASVSRGVLGVSEEEVLMVVRVYT